MPQDNVSVVASDAPARSISSIPGQTGVAAGAGAVGATVQRVTVATDDGLHTKIGEVTASPTSNTILDRLKTLATSLAGTLTVTQPAAATGGYSYNHIATNLGTTVVKGSAGTLHSITFNSAAAATNTTTLYDHAATATGSVIAIIDAPTIDAPVTLIYDLAFANGLTFATTSASGADMTVCYK